MESSDWEFFKIASAGPTRSARPEFQLKEAGDAAAVAFFEGKAASLSDAVALQVANRDYSEDEITRVVEASNQAAWRRQFHEDGDSTEFAPASLTDVLAAGSEKVAGVQETAHSDYDDPTHINAPFEFDNFLVFGVSSGAEEVGIDPAETALADFAKVASALEASESRYGHIKAAHAQAVRDVVGEMTHLFQTERVGFRLLGEAVLAASTDEDFARGLMKTAAVALRRNGNDLAAHEQSSEGLVLDTTHPFLEHVRGLEKLSSSLLQAEEERALRAAQRRDAAHQYLARGGR